MKVTPEVIKAVAKAADPAYKPKAAVVNGIVEWWSVAEDAGITSVNEIAAFLGQACIETGGFRTLIEDGGPNYWKRYEGRKDLGNTEYGYGVKYPGRGIFQNTGYANMVILSKRLGPDFVTNPELLQTPEWSMKAAVDYWKQKKLGPIAKAGNFKGVGRAINRGNASSPRAAYHEAERLQACNKAVTLLGKLPDAPAAKPIIVPAKPNKIVMANPPKDYKGDQVVFYVQSLLDKKGWREVGTIDGKMGMRTEGVILAYRNEYKPPLPLVSSIDQELVTALEVGPDRTVSVERAGATAADLREAGDETIRTVDTTKVVTGSGGALALLGAIDQQGLVDRAKAAVDGAGTAREVLEHGLDLLQWLAQKWWIPVLLLCVVILWYLNGVVKKRLQDHRTGANLEL